jgi:hypothetical protein
MTITERYDRQTSILPVEKLQEISVLIVGVGAIGRPTALLASATGFNTISICDPDTVEPHNLAAQGYKESDIGHYKVTCLATEMHDTNSETCYKNFTRKFDETMLDRVLDASEVPYRDRKLVVISCVDSIEVRKEIWEAASKHNNLELFLDARMSGPIIQVYGAQKGWTSSTYYPTSLFSEEEAFNAPCSARSMLYPCYIAAGMMVSQISNWIRGIPVEPYISLNLNDMSDISMEDRIVPTRLEEATVSS